LGVNGGRREPIGGGEQSSYAVASVSREKGEEEKREERKKKGPHGGLSCLSRASPVGATESCHLLWHD
jgi:hypothetical protein